MNYRQAIHWLFSTQMFGIKLGLDGPRRLLREFLAYPEHGVTVIHVAGTNGKGSTCAMMDSIARSCGRRTGLFTSPHLIDFRERIQVSGQEIPEENCAALLTELRAICERLDPHPTFFEIALALAMRWFRERACELIILETGMGGRLDATTAVPADLCVITPIGLDHTQWLGETLEEIALEKTGILVEGKPCISSPQHPDAARVIEMEANEKRAPLLIIGEPLLGYPIPLSGEHQAWNAALAVTALHRAGLPIGADNVRHGLSRLQWPGRFEKFDHHGKTVVLDGAHNPHSASVLAATWELEFPSVKPSLVFSAVATKDLSGILTPLAPLCSRIHFCPVATPRAVPPEQLASSLPPAAPPHGIHPGFEEAFRAALENPGPVLVAGSLYLVGQARAHLTGRDFQSSTQ